VFVHFFIRTRQKSPRPTGALSILKVQIPDSFVGDNLMANRPCDATSKQDQLEMPMIGNGSKNSKLIFPVAQSETHENPIPCQTAVDNFTGNGRCFVCDATLLLRHGACSG
jgi:hypothetical protein